MITPATAVAVIVLVLAAFAWVGFRSRHASGDVEDFMVARGSQPSSVLALSFLASGLGAWILFAPPEVGAFVGLVGVVGYALGAAAPIAVFALLGPRLRRVVPAGHGLTEFIRLRYGRVFHVYVVGISIMYMLMFLTAELTAVGGVAAILSGVDARVAVLTVAVVTLAYTAYGGLRASLRTDRWQAWLVVALLVVGIGVTASVVSEPGQALVASGRIAVDRLGIEAALTLIIAVTAANMFHQGYWQRVWAARDDAALRRGGLVGVIVSVPIVLVLGLAGMLAVGVGADLGEPPVPFFALFTGLAPWVAAVVLVLGVALVTSSVDTLENGLAALVSIERPSMTVTGARLVTVALMVPATAVAFQGYSVLRLLLIADLLCATAVVPALLGLWRRATPAGALAGAVAGLAGAAAGGIVATGSVAEGLLFATFPGAVPTLPPFLGALVASSVVAVAVSLTTEGGTPLDRLNEQVPVLGADR